MTDPWDGFWQIYRTFSQIMHFNWSVDELAYMHLTVLEDYPETS